MKAHYWKFADIEVVYFSLILPLGPYVGQVIVEVEKGLCISLNQDKSL